MSPSILRSAPRVWGLYEVRATEVLRPEPPGGEASGPGLLIVHAVLHAVWLRYVVIGVLSAA